MENKRLKKKLNTFFWWVLMSLPLILMIIMYIFALPQQAKNFDWANNSWVDFISEAVDNSDIFDYLFNQFNNMSVVNFFPSVLEKLGVWQSYFGYLLNWCASIFLYHLIFDCVVFIFDWLHDFFERG